METFGEYIRGKRQSLGLFLRDVSEATGFTISMLSKLETGSRQPTFNRPDSRMEKLAKVLQISPEDMDFIVSRVRGEMIVNLSVLPFETAHDLFITIRKVLNASIGV